MPKVNYDLEERTAKFGIEVINLAKSVPQNSITSPIVNQLIRSATSVGANYCEADDAESAKDFIHKLGICKKEAHETKHWLRMLAIAHPAGKELSRKLWQEAKELHLIFNSIINKTKSNL